MVVETPTYDSRSDDPVVPPTLIRPADTGAAWLRQYSAGRWTVIEAVGEIDIAVAPAMRQMLYGAPSPFVVFDLRRVGFIDASGLGVLAAAWHRGKENGGAVRLVAPVGRSRRILELTHIDEVIEIFEGLAEASA